MENYTVIGYEIYECPQNPTDMGKYYGKIRYWSRRKRQQKTQRKAGKYFLLKWFAATERKNFYNSHRQVVKFPVPKDKGRKKRIWKKYLLTEK